MNRRVGAIILAVGVAGCTSGPTLTPAVSTHVVTAAPTGRPTPGPAHGCTPSGPPLALLPSDAAADPADDFIDPVTGHRVVRLSRLENGGSNFYFHQDEFNCRGNKLVFANAHGDLGRWLYAIDLETMEIQPLAESSAPIMEVVAPKRNEVLYLAADGSLRATNLDTRATRTIAMLPAGSYGFSVNADETLIGGYYNEGLADYRAQYPAFGDWFTRYYAAHLLSYVYTVDYESGAIRKLHEEHTWLDHVQFSPTDPNLLIFSHEGPSVPNRTWITDVSTTEPPRALIPNTATEGAVHEFFDPTGTAVYYDHQQPAGGAHSIGRVDVATGARSDNPIAARDWGAHYNIGHGGTMFASDGDPGGRKLAMLFHLVDGRLVPEPLADLSASDYEFQPLVQFTRDDRWVVYQTSASNVVQVYAVEVAKH